MFSNIIVTGQYAWTPSSRVLFEDDTGYDGNHNANDDEYVLEEECDD